MNCIHPQSWVQALSLVLQAQHYQKCFSTFFNHLKNLLKHQSQALQKRSKHQNTTTEYDTITSFHSESTAHSNLIIDLAFHQNFAIFAKCSKH